MPTVEVNLDNVVIEGTVIARPTRIPRSIWLSYWEGVQAIVRPKT